MRYAQMRQMDISNGEGVGISLFVQGCHFHCKDCFNQETWDFNGGYEWDDKSKEKFYDLANHSYITRISILGGEPLAQENMNEVLLIIKEIRQKFPDKKIWLYSGYTWEEIFSDKSESNMIRQDIIKQCDMFIDGPFVSSLRNLSLLWKGSSNQRVIDVRKALEKNDIVICERN